MNKLVFDRPVLNPPRFHDEPWTLACDWTVVFRGEYYHLPAGFETDGASIPRLLWWICGTPLEVPRLYAALVHAFIYGGNAPEATRAAADDLYRDLQLALGVPRWKCYVEWAALRLFGKSHWYKRKERNP